MRIKNLRKKQLDFWKASENSWKKRSSWRHFDNCSWFTQDKLKSLKEKSLWGKQDYF